MFGAIVNLNHPAHTERDAAAPDGVDIPIEPSGPAPA